MANDVSHFYVRDDPTKYSFDDADAEERITDETERAETAEQTNAANIGTLSSLTTTAKSNLVAAINEVDAGVDALNSNLECPNITTDLKTWAMSKDRGFYTFLAGTYTDTGAPTQNYSWSLGYLMNVGGMKTIVIFGRGGSTGGRARIAKCGYYNSEWSDWIEFVGTALT